MVIGHFKTFLEKKKKILAIKTPMCYDIRANEDCWGNYAL